MRPLILEIVGPAGVGKTTIAQTLKQYNKKILINFHFTRLRLITSFTRSAFPLIPVLLQQYQNSRLFTWQEIKYMLFLRLLHYVLKRKLPDDCIVSIQEHGSVHMLTVLYTFGPESINSKSFKKWWDNTLNRWRSTLDTIIYLEASNNILLERICSRNRDHRIKKKSAQEAYTFLMRYRTSIEYIISKLATNGGPKVLRYNTEQEALNQIVDKIIVKFDM